MILYEFEGKKILSQNDIKVPGSQVVRTPGEKINVALPFFIKAQVLSGKRKVAGGIALIEKEADIAGALSEMLGSLVNGEKVEKVLVEEKIDFSKEYYISISYDTDHRCPVVTYSQKGGTGIEERKTETFPVNILTKEIKFTIELPDTLKSFIKKLLDLFLNEDATLVEVNPAVIAGDGKVYALDAKIKLDDNAISKHTDSVYSPRSISGYTPTQRELEAKRIDEGDYRGTAGSAYFDLHGDIAVLASGGGGSLTAMDALIKFGASPANYTEYSGNPPKEKVEKLTKIVLSKPNLKGLWIVGAVANFTNILETLTGFLEALKKVDPKPKYPIVIRRGGPMDKEAFEMLSKEKEFDFHLFGPEISITKSAEIMADLSKKYATTT